MSTAKITSKQTPNVTKALWWGIAASFVFTAIIWLARPLMPQIDFLPDAGASWYYWKLPNPTFWTHFTAWTGYALHQVTIWGIIYYAQSTKLKYSNRLHPANWWMLGANVFFIALHLLQTSIWYDGLAQDVSIWSSQASVVLMLVAVLLMENQRRGLFFGKKVNWLKESARFLRKYHGYIFMWGIIYTFWYHPMENTAGHLFGFWYTFVLLLQGSLMFTRAHLNRWWTVLLEIVVLAHGTVVAILQGNQLWPMFAFGFAAIFIVTQMHGLGLSRRWRWAFGGAYVASAVFVYSQRGWIQLNEIIRIPAIEYLAVFLLAGIVWLGMLIVRTLSSKKMGRNLT